MSLGAHCFHLPLALIYIYIPSTLPISFLKERGNLGAGICAPAWVPSCFRGHHRPSARSPREGMNLCVPSPHRTDNQGRKDGGKSYFLWDRSLKAWLGDCWHGEEGKHAMCLPYPLEQQRNQAAHSSQEHNNAQESGLDLDGALHSPIFNY